MIHALSLTRPPSGAPSRKEPNGNTRFCYQSHCAVCSLRSFEDDGAGEVSAFFGPSGTPVPTALRIVGDGDNGSSRAPTSTAKTGGAPKNILPLLRIERRRVRPFF